MHDVGILIYVARALMFFVSQPTPEVSLLQCVAVCCSVFQCVALMLVARITREVSYFLLVLF